MYPPDTPNTKRRPVPGVGNPGAMNNSGTMAVDPPMPPQETTAPITPQSTTRTGSVAAGMPSGGGGVQMTPATGGIPSAGGGVQMTPAAPTPAAPPPTPPTPPMAPPAPDWQPSQDGTGWVPPGHPQAWQPPAAAPAAPGAPGAPPTPAPGAVPPSMPMTAGDVTGTQAASPQGPPTSIAQSFQQALVGRLNPAAATADNPGISGSIQANRLAEQRGVEAQRNRLAEQAARDGTSGAGGMESMQRGLLADSAARQGQYSGDKVQHISDRDNQSMLAALGMSGDFLQQNANRDQQGSQFGQTLAEQRRQADQASELQRLGINTQSSLGQGDLALRGRLGEGGLNNQLLGMLLNDRQFGRQLGQQNTQFGASLDQNGILGLLGLM